VRKACGIAEAVAAGIRKRLKTAAWLGSVGSDGQQRFAQK